MKNSELIAALQAFPADTQVFVKDDGEARPPWPVADIVGDDVILGGFSSKSDSGPYYHNEAKIKAGEKTLIL